MSQLQWRIEPFSALTFNCDQAGRLEDLIAPPYDLIDEAKQQQLYARSPHNVVRLELNCDPDPYTSASRILERWIADGLLQRTGPAIFLYTQTFELNGRKLTRGGWVVRVRLEEFASGRILPHERTFPKAKEDRLRLLAATRANISPVFGLFPSGNQELENLMRVVTSRPAILEALDDSGSLNQVRTVDSPAEIRTLQQALEHVRVLIADGHHRYETSLEYRRRSRGRLEVSPSGSSDAPPPSFAGENQGEGSVLRPEDYVMMTLVAFNDPGLVILPTHRIVRALGDDQIKAYEARVRDIFDVEEFDDPAAMIARLNSLGRGYIGAAIKGKPASILHLRDQEHMSRALPDIHERVRQLDVAVLHTLILDKLLAITPEMVRGGNNISYTVDTGTALQAVASGSSGAFLLTAPTVYDVENVCNAGATMPEKSTYFHPKLQTGLLINPLY